MKDNILDQPLEPAAEININLAYDAIFATFAELVPTLPQEFFERFRVVTYPVSFKPNQVVVDYGDICKHCYFMLSGVVRSTKILQGRGETAVWFHQKGDVLIAVDSFFKQILSDEKLTTIIETFCIDLPWSDLQVIYKDFPQFHIVSRLLTESYLSRALERTTWFYESPEVRFEHIMRDYPIVAEYVSVKELASYLGIARETLSRLRRRFARRGKNAGN